MTYQVFLLHVTQHFTCQRLCICSDDYLTTRYHMNNDWLAIKHFPWLPFLNNDAQQTLIAQLTARYIRDHPDEPGAPAAAAGV